MRMILYIALTLIGLVLTAAGFLGICGTLMPASHTASVSVEVGSPRDVVWAAIDDPPSFPSWCDSVDKIEMMPDKDGHRVFRQVQGRNSFVLEETAKQPPSLVTRTITDENNLFNGSWEHRLEDLGNGRTRITITEHGTVNAAIPRAMMKLLIGNDLYLKKFGAVLKSKFGA